jgi:medium-chain acyl-[acyl-carrier-protein] hydrolase
MSNANASPWFRSAKVVPGARLRLFCLPYAGGGASAFSGWLEPLPRGVELWPAQLPGRESRFNEPAFRRLGPLVEELTRVVLPLLTMPYAVYGHSMGSVVGFELLRALRQRGAPPAVCFFASGHSAPQLPPRHKPAHALGDREFTDFVRSLGGTPPEVLQNAELLELLLPLLRCDFELLETYVCQPGPPLECPIRALGGKSDVYTPMTDLEAWREHTRTFLGARMLDGGHFFIHESRQAVLRGVSEDLMRYLGGA